MTMIFNDNLNKKLFINDLLNILQITILIIKKHVIKLVMLYHQ